MKTTTTIVYSDAADSSAFSVWSENEAGESTAMPTVFACAGADLAARHRDRGGVIAHATPPDSRATQCGASSRSLVVLLGVWNGVCNLPVTSGCPGPLRPVERRSGGNGGELGAGRGVRCTEHGHGGHVTAPVRVVAASCARHAGTSGRNPVRLASSAAR